MPAPMPLPLPVLSPAPAAPCPAGALPASRPDAMSGGRSPTGEAATGRAASARTARDPRLDVFRGLCMLIIFVAHVPENPWLAWIPARFGFSSATELFVFGSGFASALAFGRTFGRDGFGAGTLRIGLRVWQLYWTHLALFVALAGLTALSAPETSHAREALRWAFSEPAHAIAGLVTLTYVPMLLDILPLYIVILALVPVMMALRRARPVLPFVLSAGLYVAAWHGLALPGRPETGAPWFFNPFAWQALFFLGYAFGLGWLKPPALGQPLLTTLCAAVVIVAVPFNFWAFTDAFPVLVDWLTAAFPLNTWTNLHASRALHFLALAYLTLTLLERARWLLDTPVAAVLTVVGQQSLPAFLVCTVLAWGGGIALDRFGFDAVTVAAVNVTGLGLIVAGAWIAGQVKAVRG